MRDRLAEALAEDMVDIGAALLERRDLAGIDVDADYGEAVVEQRLHQRQADIAETDNADRRAAVAEPARQLFDGRTCGWFTECKCRLPQFSRPSPIR